MSADERADMSQINPVESLSPRVAYEVVRALEDALLAPIDDGEEVCAVLDSLQAALLTPSPDERTILEAVKRLEESLRVRSPATGQSRAFGEAPRDACVPHP